jgi:hypothetical protein
MYLTIYKRVKKRYKHVICSLFVKRIIECLIYDCGNIFRLKNENRRFSAVIFFNLLELY